MTYALMQLATSVRVYNCWWFWIVRRVAYELRASVEADFCWWKWKLFSSVNVSLINRISDSWSLFIISGPWVLTVIPQQYYKVLNGLKYWLIFFCLSLFTVNVFFSRFINKSCEWHIFAVILAHFCCYFGELIFIWKRVRFWIKLLI